MTEVELVAAAILTAHQRRDVGSCLCGWSELGKSHPVHQVAMLRAAVLRAAALLADDPAADIHGRGSAPLI